MVAKRRIASRYERTAASTASRRAAGARSSSRPAIATLAASRLTSHSHGPGSVSFGAPVKLGINRPVSPGLVQHSRLTAQGGATVFPDVNLEVAPIKGNAVFFSYDRPHPMTRSLHGGTPVVAGEKWVATKWLREGRFD